jgi:transcriptional regulator with XRE-family HTH domain
VTTRERASDRGRRRGERLLEGLLREARDARVARNLSQRAVGNALGLSNSRISIIESGGYSDIPFVVLSQLLAVVGLDLSARAYPAGGGIRDAGQLKLLERLRVRVANSFTWRTEVAMPIPGDLRAWDAALMGRALRIGVDAETRLRDIQAVDRRVMLKLRDSAFDRAILLVAATRNNRLAMREAGASLRENYPVPARIALKALSAGHDPGGNSLIML